MPSRNSSGYIRDVDQLIENTPLDHVLEHYGQQTPEKSAGEHRIDCVFTESCVDSTYGQLRHRARSAESPSPAVRSS